MKVLIISNQFPMPDRNSGELRFFSILTLLARHHQVFYHCYIAEAQSRIIGKETIVQYIDGLKNIGVTVLSEHIKHFLPKMHFDCVFFEFYYTAVRHLDKVRFWQPHARIIVDSVDVHFKRIFSEAAVTGSKEVSGKAKRMKKRELAAYNKADIVIAVTEPDKKALLDENKKMHVEIIPNIHEMEPLQDCTNPKPSLVFVGGFNHNPNVDAVLFFYNEILPLIKKQIPDVTLDIVGYSPPPEIRDLASDTINVTGFVPDTKPYLLSNRVSIAPLRFGAGMKGKIGEAMAHGVPVVTTSIGSEGFGLTHEENILVGDTPDEFAQSVIRLLTDTFLYEKIRRNGWEFIRQRYSHEAVEKIIMSVFENVPDCQIKKIGFSRNVIMKISNFYDKYFK